MHDKFRKFIDFGSVADVERRKQVAEVFYERLRTGTNALSNVDIGNFASSAENILSNKTMRDLCAKDASLAEQITQEILDFINKTKRKFARIESRFDKEQSLLASFREVEKRNFAEAWEHTSVFLRETYDKYALDIDFYSKQFQESLAQTRKKGRKRIQFASVKEHFAEKWSKLLSQKLIAQELAFIDEERKKFCEELYKRIEELKKIQEILEPFTNELGRLWDMSKGEWQKINFDILKTYAELLQRDKSLQELAEMLGRMHSAEREYEEELFTDITIKYEWKIEHAQKADLVGVHESDDISSLLPSETALLADKTTEHLFYKKFAEKKLQTFEYQAKVLAEKEERIENKRQKEKEDAKGPFIICVDTSGSMHGIPETVAKTLCFAILKVAIRENRKCYLVSFSTSIETLNLADIKNSLDKLIAFLSMSFYGGTDAMPAMHEALKMLETNDYKKADIIMISDFVMPSLDEQAQSKIKAAKKNKTKFHSLIIGGSGNKNIIDDFDNNWIYDANNKNCVLQMVKDLNAIE
jgi:uncharacterized protein with von Willebrand factor type A (vWA) domain